MGHLVVVVYSSYLLIQSRILNYSTYSSNNNEINLILDEPSSKEKQETDSREKTQTNNPVNGVTINILVMLKFLVTLEGITIHRKLARIPSKFPILPRSKGGTPW